MRSVKKGIVVDKFRSHLWRQLSFLSASSTSYDNGFLDEAIRIAVVIRVLVHQTRRSTSLLAHLNATEIHLLSTCPKMPLDGATMMMGLGAIQNGAYFAHLDRASCRRMVTVDEWWNEIVYVLGEGTHLTRKDVVLGAANKDGGAHVDPQLTPKYAKLISFFQVGTFQDSGKCEWEDANAHYVALRQMAFELLRSPELFLQANFPATENSPLSDDYELSKYRPILTEHVRTLVDEYNALRPQYPVVLNDVENGPDIPGDAVSEYIYSTASNDVIRFCPSKSSEFHLAQEISKGIYYRSGWPIIIPVLPMSQDGDAQLIALKIGHVLRQKHILHRLDNMGIDTAKYRDSLINAITSWPNTRIGGQDLFRASLNILEVMLMGKDYRAKIVESARKTQPEALQIAEGLEVFLQYNHEYKIQARQCIIEMIDYVGKVISSEMGLPFQIRRRLQISPFYLDKTTSKPANEELELTKFTSNFGEKAYRIIGLVSKSEGILIGRILFELESGESQEKTMKELHSQLNSMSTKEFLSIHNIPYFYE